MNKCTFIGNVGNEPDIRNTPAGLVCVNFSIACTKRWRDKNTGEKQERTEWIRISAFGKLAEIIGEWVHKGSKIYIAGEMRTRDWEDKEGQKRSTTEIVADEMEMLDSRERSAATNQPEKSTQPEKTTQENTAPGAGSADDFDDDIPFAPFEKGRVV